MKKFILFFIALQAFFFPAFAADGTVTFDNSRTVVILDTTQDNYAATYLSKSIREPFRIPYWNRIDAEETISPKDITVARFEELAAKYGADLIIIPFVNHWYWRQYHNILTYEDDIYTEYDYRLSVYVYNRETGTVETYGVNGRGREEAITLNVFPQTVVTTIPTCRYWTHTRLPAVPKSIGASTVLYLSKRVAVHFRYKELSCKRIKKQCFFLCFLWSSPRFAAAFTTGIPIAPYVSASA